MHVTQIARRFVRHEWGGVETAVLETCRQLQAMGHETEIATSAALSHPGEELIRGVRIERHAHFYPYLGLSREARQAMDVKGGNLFSLPLLRSLQQKRELDLLHVHTLNRVGAIARYVARQRRIPYVVSIHGGVHDLPDEQARLLREPSRGALEWGKVIGWWLGSHHVVRDADLVICFGQRECELTRDRYPNTRVEWLTHGVDVQRFTTGNGAQFRQQHAIPLDARVLLSIARIDPQKDQASAIRTLPAILRSEPKAHLVLMGPVTDSAYLAELTRNIGQLGLSSKVTVLPGVAPEDPALVDAYHTADLFVLPSMHEVFGIVVLEAWASGLPVVASNIGGIRSLVRDGRDGLLFDRGSDDTFVAHCLTMLQDKELSHRIRIEAFDRVTREFSWQSVTNKLVHLYEEVACERVAS